MRSATSDPELKRHFFSSKGEERDKSKSNKKKNRTSIHGPLITSDAFDNILHTAGRRRDVAGAGVRIRGRLWERTQLTDAQLRAGGSGENAV